MKADETIEASDRPDQGRSATISPIARIINLFGVGAVIGTLIGFGASQHWLADVAAQFRVQYLCMLLPAVGLWIGTRSMKLLIVGGLALVVNLWPVAPYWLPQSEPVSLNQDSGRQSGQSFRLAVMNVLRTNGSFQSTLESVVDQNADFVFLMEVQPAWKPLLEKLQDRYPHQKLICRQDYTGVAFLSKYDWDRLEVINLDDIANPPIDVQFPRLATDVPEFRIIATHPLPPFGPRLTNSRDRQLLALAKRIRTDQASLLVGDFNLTPWSPRFNQILDIGQLRDASLGYGVSPTLTPLPTPVGGLKVDHVLINHRVSIVGYRLSSDNHSDHQCVIVDFDIVGPRTRVAAPH